MKNLFINRPILAMVLSIVIVILGIISLRGIPVEQYPNITPPSVLVRATYQGADAVTVDQAVATPLAQGVMGVENMLYMKSTSSNDGQMALRVTFDVDSDPDMDAIFTQNNISAVEAMLPATVKNQGVTTRKSMSGFLMIFSLYSDGVYDNKYLSNYAFINIQNELLKISGVGDVRVLGAGQYSMRIWVKPDMMSYHNISVGDIASAVESQSGVYPAGQLGAEPSSPGTDFTYAITMPPQINTPEEYKNIVIRSAQDGSQVLLSDVARVEFGSQTYGVSSSFAGKPSAAIIVYQTPGSNAVEVGTKVKEAMQRASARFDDGIKYETIVDATSSIKAGIKDIFVTLFIALILVIAIIYLFIQDLRAIIIPLVAIPVSILGAFMLFPLFGFTINTVSLLGLVLAMGLVVDDSIVVVEAVQVGIEKGHSARQATIEAMKTVRAPVIATTVVLIAVFVPVAFAGGITGKLYQQFAITIASSVIISTINALTLSPALCSLLMKPRKKHERGFFGVFNKIFDRGVKGYMSISSTLIRHSGRTVVFIAIIAAALVIGWNRVPSGFLPNEDQGFLMVALRLPDASSLQRTIKVAHKAEQIIAKHPDVRFTTSTAGFDMISEVTSTHSGIVFINLKDYSDRKHTAEQIAKQLNSQLNSALPDAVVAAFGPPAIPGLGVSSAISLFVQDEGGNDPSYLSRNTKIFIEQARKLPSIASVTTQFNNGIPQRRLRINRDYALREGVSLDELHSVLTTYLGGSYLTNFNRFARLYQTYIQADASYRQDEHDLGSYFVRNRNGISVPITAFVSISDTVGAEFVSQFNLYRSAALSAATTPGYSTDQGMDDLQELASRVLPPDMGIAWSDISYQERAASGGWIVYVYALIFVFLALVALYNSWMLPASVLLGVPFAIFGALLFIFLAHLINPLYINNIFMQISLVMLIGLSAKNAILIVEYANTLFFVQHKSLLKAAVGAARVRIRPIIMTALAFLFGVLPLALASGAFSQARNVMGVALLGGMFVGTLLGIFVYPSLFVIIGKLGNFEKKRASKPMPI